MFNNYPRYIKLSFSLSFRLYCTSSLILTQLRALYLSGAFQVQHFLSLICRCQISLMTTFSNMTEGTLLDTLGASTISVNLYTFYVACWYMFCTIKIV